MKRDYKLFIKDILEAIERIEKFTKNMDYQAFFEDEKTNSAVVWQILIIGEATKNIPKVIKEKYKDIPWKEMAGMRDKISHAYFGIDFEIVWKVIQDRLPEIKPKIEKILKELKQK
ncbi:HepT-like ribonuclease domain-containing protein [Thermodesulfovibrio hydrogeniphilus]